MFSFRILSRLSVNYQVLRWVGNLCLNGLQCTYYVSWALDTESMIVPNFLLDPSHPQLIMA